MCVLWWVEWANRKCGLEGRRGARWRWRFSTLMLRFMQSLMESEVLNAGDDGKVGRMRCRFSIWLYWRSHCAWDEVNKNMKVTACRRTNLNVDTDHRSWFVVLPSIYRPPKNAVPTRMKIVYTRALFSKPLKRDPKISTGLNNIYRNAKVTKQFLYNLQKLVF